MICIARRLGAPVTEPPGKVGGQQRAEADLRAQPPAHGRDQVVDRRQRDHPRQRRDLDAARAADAPEIVALEIDDHDVLGAVLGGGGELGGRRAIGGRVGAAGAGPLDGAGLDHAVGREREKPLGRVAQDRERRRRRRRLARGDERGVRRRGPGPQRRRQATSDRPRVQVAPQPPRQVHLIGVSRLQVVEDPAHPVQKRRPSGSGASSAPRRGGSVGRGRRRRRARRADPPRPCRARGSSPRRSRPAPRPHR